MRAGVAAATGGTAGSAHGRAAVRMDEPCAWTKDETNQLEESSVVDARGLPDGKCSDHAYGLGRLMPNDARPAPAGAWQQGLRNVRQVPPSSSGQTAAAGAVVGAGGGLQASARRCLLLAALCVACCSLLSRSAIASTSGDVFVAYAADGVPSYASQPLGPGYRLFLRGEPASSPRSSGRTPAAARISARRDELAPLIEHYARTYEVSPDLVRAVVRVESGFNARAVSRKGATGAMQLMPATAARYGVTRLADPAQNIDAGVRHLRDLLAQHQGNVALALAAYNAGRGAVTRYGERIPPYRETMLYVPAVLAAAARGNSQ